METQLQYSCLENPMDRGAWQATVHGIAQSGTRLKWLNTHPCRMKVKGNDNPLQCSCLENPRDGGAWWAAVYGVAQSWTRLKRLSSSSSRCRMKGTIAGWLLDDSSRGQYSTAGVPSSLYLLDISRATSEDVEIKATLLSTFKQLAIPWRNQIKKKSIKMWCWNYGVT